VIGDALCPPLAGLLLAAISWRARAHASSKPAFLCSMRCHSDQSLTGPTPSAPGRG
jgi:hypothetical protein